MRIPKGISSSLKKSSLVRTCYHYATGILSYISPNLMVVSTEGTMSARYCYSVFLRHLVNLHKNGMQKLPKKVAELGPGDSIGVGLCALLTGANEYYALDVIERTDLKRNLAVFEELIELFKMRADIPGEEEFPEVHPLLSDYSFPSHVLSDEVLSNSLSADRVEKIRNILGHTDKDHTDITIKYLVPWMNYKGTFPTVDLIMSQAALEHVDDLELAYKTMSSILSPDGYMSHEIDFRSHGITREWNGHWAKPEYLWKLIRGKKVYLINREPLSAYINLTKEAGLNILDVQRAAIKELSIKRESLKGEYAKLSEDDFQTRTCYIVSAKRA